jgi:hypothetical protein
LSATGANKASDGGQHFQMWAYITYLARTSRTTRHDSTTIPEPQMPDCFTARSRTMPVVVESWFCGCSAARADALRLLCGGFVDLRADALRLFCGFCHRGPWRKSSTASTIACIRCMLSGWTRLTIRRERHDQPS